LLAEHIRGVTNTTDNTETTSVGDSGGQLGPRGHVHACQQDGVVDLKKIGERSTDLLCSAFMVNIRVSWAHTKTPVTVGDHMQRVDIGGENKRGHHLRGEAILKMWMSRE
jgi:hypothetical protein